jgi:acyl-CoA oxidase
MVGDSANTAKRALTIATRYAAIRRQFSSGKGKVRSPHHITRILLTRQVETQILDYPIHQRRLMVSYIPLLDPSH